MINNDTLVLIWIVGAILYGFISISVGKHGEDEAKQMAIEFTNSFEKHTHYYTVKHGESNESI